MQQPRRRAILIVGAGSDWQWSRAARAASWRRHVSTSARSCGSASTMAPSHQHAAACVFGGRVCHCAVTSARSRGVAWRPCAWATFLAGAPGQPARPVQTLPPRLNRRGRSTRCGRKTGSMGTARVPPQGERLGRCRYLQYLSPWPPAPRSCPGPPACICK